MNRKQNTIAFLVAATLLNLVLMFFFFLGFAGIAGIFVPVRTGAVAVGFTIGLFVLALMSTWFTYRWVYALLKQRFQIDRYLDPQIFKDRF